MRRDEQPVRPGETTPVTDDLNEEIMRFVQLLKSPAGGDGSVDRSALLLLWPLVHGGPMRISDLATAKGLDVSTVSRQVAQLVAAGLVRRDPDPVDRRATRLVVTDGGHGACRSMIETRRRIIAEALHDWDPGRLREFTALFREFNQAIERHQARVPGARGSAPSRGSGQEPEAHTGPSPAPRPAPPAHRTPQAGRTEATTLAQVRARET